mmetsp:Transcript_8114/g.16848  ORF Transcript_8114/g.16848 Transcript_8114/m.16848 type:complete len:318 (-) Transcript_8114:52-1005(-)
MAEDPGLSEPRAPLEQLRHGRRAGGLPAGPPERHAGGRRPAGGALCDDPEQLYRAPPHGHGPGENQQGVQPGGGGRRRWDGGHHERATVHGVAGRTRILHRPHLRQKQHHPAGRQGRVRAPPDQTRRPDPPRAAPARPGRSRRVPPAHGPPRPERDGPGRQAGLLQLHVLPPGLVGAVHARQRRHRAQPRERAGHHGGGRGPAAERRPAVVHDGSQDAVFSGQGAGGPAVGRVRLRGRGRGRHPRSCRRRGGPHRLRGGVGGGLERARPDLGPAPPDGRTGRGRHPALRLLPGRVRHEPAEIRPLALGVERRPLYRV